MKNWALKFGVDLWEFGRQFTKMSEIQRVSCCALFPAVLLIFAISQKYREHDVKVSRKDGLILIREMAAEVKNMMDMKMNAVLVSVIVKYLFQSSRAWGGNLFCHTSRKTC